MAQNQHNRQLRDEVFNVLDYMRDNDLLQLEILEALKNDQSFMDGLTEEQVMSHVGQEVVQSAPENQDTSKMRSVQYVRRRKEREWTGRRSFYTSYTNDK
ncbi:hypothetical protein SESBI_22149 [Sesbania bispinosa]|nr:hypothetical protein SESBI_22149 [Sesbania bispinosa]